MSGSSGTPWSRWQRAGRDGTAGLQKDASLAALRQKIEAAAHIMFASSPRERDYWLGRSESAGAEGNHRDIHRLSNPAFMEAMRTRWTGWARPIKSDIRGSRAI